MSTAPSDEIVRLITARNPIEAHIWEQTLTDAGIPCKVVGDLLDAGIGDVPGMSPEIWVHRRDVARAEEVLRSGEAVSEEDLAAQEEAGEDEPEG